MSRAPGLADLLVLASAFALINKGFFAFAEDPGVGWHLETGRLILETGQVPHIDPFLAFSVERTWVSDQWLSDLLLSAIHTHLGWPGLYAFLCLAFLTAYYVFVYRTAALISGSYLAAAIVTFICLRMGALHFILRPVIFGILFFGMTFSMVSLIRRKALTSQGFDHRALLKLGLPLSLLFALWANMHPSFFLGFVVLGFAVLSFLVDPWIVKEHAPQRWRFFQLAMATTGVLAVCILATLINPYGPRLHFSILELGGSEFFLRLNNEWQSPDFATESGTLVRAFVVVILVSNGLAFAKRQRPDTFLVLTALFFAVFYLKSVRFLPFLSIALAPLAAVSLSNLSKAYCFESVPFLGRLRTVLSHVNVRESHSLKGLAGLAVTAVFLTVGALRGAIPGYTDGYGPSHEEFPYEAVQFLQEHAPHASVYATPNWGGFITRMGGSVQPYLDDRNTLLGEQIYRDYLDVASLRDPHWIETLQETACTYLLVKTHCPLHRGALYEGFEVAFESDDFILFELPRRF